MALVVAILVVSNVMANRVLPDWLYLPWNLAVAALLMTVGLRVADREQLGFARWSSGALWGGILFAGMVVTLGVGLALPGTRGLFEDDRVDGSVALLAYHTLLRIPFGTALMEEVAFRAVLPGLLAVRLGVLRACLVASALFGLWHVLPAWGVHESNEGIGGWLGSSAMAQVATVTGAVLGTMIVGLWWCWVRYRSGSVLATVIGHTASNSLAYAAAWFVTR